MRKALMVTSSRNTAVSKFLIMQPIVRVLATVFALVTLVCSSTKAQDAGTRIGKSGLPLPRYGSLKSDEVNVRKGPGQQYPISWVYRRAGLPVEIISEYENWREIRDADGTSGWVFRPLLSNRRTAQLIPWKITKGKAIPIIDVLSRPSSNAGAVVSVEAGVIANIRWCDGQWCHLTVGEHPGYIAQGQLWGVYKSETIR